jgi:hypothetical protein
MQAGQLAPSRADNSDLTLDRFRMLALLSNLIEQLAAAGQSLAKQCCLLLPIGHWHARLP